MKRALVTGANGFIGRNTLPVLKSMGYEVFAIDKVLPVEPHADETWVSVDLFNPVEVSRLLSDVKPTHLLNFAWYTEHGKYWRSEQNYRWVFAGLDLFMKFIENGGKRAVFAGTCAEYDWSGGYCSEFETLMKPATPYGVCKHALFSMMDSLSKEKDFSGAWGRVFFLYGPAENRKRIIPHVITSLLLGKKALCTHGNQTRDFLYVKDVAGAFVSLLDSDVRGPVNIALGQPVLLKDIIGMIAEITGASELVELDAIPAPENDPPVITADTRRLMDEVGWKPEFSLSRGLETTIEWWRKEIEQNHNEYKD